MVQFQIHKWTRVGLSALVFMAFGLMFLPFWKPILMASLFAFAFNKWVVGFGRRRRLLPTFIILGGFFVLISLPFIVILSWLASSLSGMTVEGLSKISLYQSIERMLSKAQTSIQSTLESFQINAEDLPQPTEIFAKVANWTVGQATSLVTNAPELMLALFVFVLALFFFLTQSREIRKFFDRLHVLNRDELDAIITVIQRSSYTTLIVSAIIGGIQAAIVSLGGLIFGYQEFVLIFVVTFFASFVPVIGAGPVAVLLALLSLADGAYGAAIGLAIVATVAGSVDNLIKPYLVSSAMEESMHPLVSLLAIIGAVMVYGLPGLLLGPILSELAMKIVPVLFKHERPAPAEPEATVKP